MSTPTTLEPLLGNLSEERLVLLIDFARFLALEEEGNDWRQFGPSQFAHACGPDEPVYTEADIKVFAAL